MDNQTVIAHVDAYRAYSRAIQIVSKAKGDDLQRTSSIVSYLYEEGHKHWVAIWALPVEQFGTAFDASRAKAVR